MALNLTELTTGGTTTPSGSVNTAVVSPAANRAQYLTVHGSVAGATAPSIPTVTGCGLTWVQVATTTNTDGVSFTQRLTLFRAMGASPTSGAITIAHGALVPDDFIAWTLQEATDADTSGTNGSGSVVQSATNTGSSTTASATLAAFGNAGNGAYIVVGTVGAGTSLTPEAGYTGFTQASHNASITRAAWKVGQDLSPSETLGATAAWMAIALEVKQVVATAGRPRGPVVVSTAVHRKSRW